MGEQEIVSVNKIKEMCSLSQYLDGKEINCNEKGIAWDGHILLYRNGKGQTNGNEYRIPVQIKGKEYSELPVKNELSYPIETKNLKDYLHDGGVLYLVVAYKRLKERY